MNPDLTDPSKGVYRGMSDNRSWLRCLPCKESTEPLAEYICDELGLGETGKPVAAVELAILRFLIDNKMRIVGE